MTTPGQKILEGAIDCHVHACPHLSGRSINILDAVRAASEAKMRGLVLMDNFQNSSGYAALAMEELGHLGVEVLGGIILQPTAGGIKSDVVSTAFGYGYQPGQGARFVSMPTHHTRHVAQLENRNADYIAEAFHVSLDGALPDEVLRILDLCAEHDVVFDCGHISGAEAIVLVTAALQRGVQRIRTHCADYSLKEIADIAALGAYCEFSYFVLSPATQVGLTHVDAEKHMIPGTTLKAQSERIRAAGDRAIVSSDSGIWLLAPPVETFRQYLALLSAEGFDDAALKRMIRINPASLFAISLDD